jgi:mycothiol synthase
MHHIEVVTQLEPPHLEHLPVLLSAAARADGHEPIGEHKFLRLKRGEDLAVAMLAYEHGSLAGYAHTVTYGHGDERRVSCEFVVHPGERRRGVGKLLLEQALQHAEAQQARRIDVWAYNDSVGSSRMAAQFGFTPARRLLHLHRHIGDAPHVAPPEGATIRAFRPGADDVPWLTLNNRIFAGHPENGAWTLDDLQARMEQPWFDANDILMLEIHGKLAGFCWLKIEERGETGRVGEIYVIGTAPEYRGIGLGRYVLSRALSHLRERETRIAAIYVDESNRAAVSLYEGNQFHHHHVDVCYSRDLPVAAGTARNEAAA